MKHKHMIDWIKYQFINHPDIHLKTANMFIEKYLFFLSNDERTQWSKELDILGQFTSKQLTIDELLRKLNIKKFEKELNDLENSN